MKSSERMLAIGVGVAVVCLIAFLTFRYYSSAVDAKLDMLAQKDMELQREQVQVNVGLAAAKKIREYEARSLPPKADLSRSLYQHWLLTTAHEAGFHDQVVTPGPQRVVPDIYTQLTFNMTGKARYEQVVKFLDDIYRIDLLHRVTRLSLKPIKDSKELDVSLTLDAVSVKTAPDASALHSRPSKRLKHDSAEKYQLAIVGRNIFAPTNRAPKISGLGRQSGTTNSAVSIAAKVSDPDPLDSVKMELTKSPSRDARLDRDGRLSWTPRKAGEYEFEITARDDNFPPNISTEKLIVKVSDPPPQPERVVQEKPVDEEPKLAFDQARHTMFTAVIGVGNDSEVWLHIRPTNTLLKLHEGDAFEVGSMKGTIREIGSNEFVFESSAKPTKGQLLLLAKGEMLERAAGDGQPKPVPTDDNKPAVEKPTIENPATEKPAPEKPAEVNTAEAKPADEPKEEKPTTTPEVPVDETRAEAKSAETKSAETKSAETKKSNGTELQNFEDIILAAKLPEGYSAVKQEIEGAGVVLAVVKEGAGAVTISRENRNIEERARRTTTKAYLNGAVKTWQGKGWTLKTKEVPNLEEVDFDKPFTVQLEFIDAAEQDVWIDITSFFSPRAHLVQVISNDPAELRRLRAWAATIKPVPLADADSKPAPAANTPPAVEAN
ncbi:hypothetical protein [Anatilimnocola floriformis]|uniref:hypothetical protein n=1 Tax=Anatilimnocola floriformis TaxID=2948575 RepID=UPI0020C47732|nr:hypothetical protein [Anatilimnocola floriformis]